MSYCKSDRYFRVTASIGTLTSADRFTKVMAALKLLFEPGVGQTA